MVTYKLRIIDDCGAVTWEALIDDNTCKFIVNTLENLLKELKKFEFECKRV
jgi:hypothetical protein